MACACVLRAGDAVPESGRSALRERGGFARVPMEACTCETSRTMTAGERADHVADTGKVDHASRLLQDWPVAPSFPAEMGAGWFGIAAETAAPSIEGGVRAEFRAGPPPEAGGARKTTPSGMPVAAGWNGERARAPWHRNRSAPVRRRGVPPLRVDIALSGVQRRASRQSPLGRPYRLFAHDGLQPPCEGVPRLRIVRFTRNVPARTPAIAARMWRFAPRIADMIIATGPGKR